MRITIEDIFQKIIILYWLTCGLTRIDLWSEGGPFRLTLGFLFATVIVIFQFAISLSNKSVIIDARLNECFRIETLFLTFVFVSALFSQDFQLSLTRFVLLFVYVNAGFFSINQMAKDNSCIYYLYMAAAFESIMYNIGSLIDYAYFLVTQNHQLNGGNLPFYNSGITSLGAYMIRTRGMSQDSNIGAIFLVVFTLLILWYGQKKWRFLLIAFNLLNIMLTQSRTALLCLLAAVLVMALKNIIKSPGKVLGGIAFVILLVFIATKIDSLRDVLYSIINRFGGDQSGSNHLSLIQVGFDIVFSNPKIFLIGNGYGASTYLLSDFFTNKYANFHNAYISFWVECGIFTLSCFVLLLLWGLRKSQKARIILIVLIVGNLGYQLYTEACFWCLIAFVYTLDELEGVDEEPVFNIEE